jgi:hypothetical protein
VTAPGWPRMMRRRTAALYCDLTPVEFEREVACGRLPEAIMLGKSEHWDRHMLDEELNRLTGQTKDWRDEQPGLAA